MFVDCHNVFTIYGTTMRIQVHPRPSKNKRNNDTQNKNDRVRTIPYGVVKNKTVKYIHSVVNCVGGVVTRGNETVVKRSRKDNGFIPRKEKQKHSSMLLHTECITARPLRMTPRDSASAQFKNVVGSHLIFFKNQYFSLPTTLF
jgi:hypothetical protein